MKKLITFASLTGLLVPALALAENTNALNQAVSQNCNAGARSLGCLIATAIAYLNQVLGLLVAVSVVVFVFYVFKYFIKPNENHDEANKYVMYSLIGFFVMLSLWGLVSILQGTFKFDKNIAPTPTEIQNLFPH